MNTCVYGHECASTHMWGSTCVCVCIPENNFFVLSLSVGFIEIKGMGKVKGKREGAEKELERYRERKGKRKNSQRQFQMSVLRYHPPLFSFSF